MKNERVIVALSGGVDSACAALRLKEEGFTVEGVCLDLFPGSTAPKEAEAIGQALSIPVTVVEARHRFRQEVMTRFCRTYGEGKTPNPCVLCNPQVKFHLLLAHADSRGVSLVATGHYARSVYHKETGRFRLLRGLDERKDQSYFLSRLTQAQLSRIRFPLGENTKDEVRETVRRLGLPVAEKRDSQEICFIGDGDYQGFLRQFAATEAGTAEMAAKGFIPGDFVDARGKVLGRHQGLACYTVGQRKGLGLALGFPAFVLALRPEENLVVIGPEEALAQHTVFTAENAFIARDLPDSPLLLHAKLRSGAALAEAMYYPGGQAQARLVFTKPQRAVTPGQTAVYYGGEEVLGAGMIFG